MANLRIVNVVISSSTSISVTFTENLTLNLVTGNVQIVAVTPNVPDSQPQLLAISSSTLTITCQPLTPLAAYNLTFVSTPDNPFISLNGDAAILQDGNSNVYLIIAPLEPENTALNYFKSYLSGNIYDLNGTNIVSTYLAGLSTILSKTLHDIDQVKNENYLSFDVIDEQQTRGYGPYDRLNEEAAYQITRVGLTPTGTQASNLFEITDFTSSPVSLQQQSVTESLTVSSSDTVGTFNINDLTISLGNSPIIILDSLIFVQSTLPQSYTYPIDTLGYQLLSGEYDQAYASSYALLSANQIRLNSQILSDPNFSPQNIVQIMITYRYKDLGIVVDPSSVSVSAVEQSVRETLPPIENIFTLAHAPITDSSGNIQTVGGVSFTDPNNLPGTLHPAFSIEIPYRLAALPSSPGQYAINYSTGTVYTFGATVANDGTGAYPPVATYNYLLTFNSELDYVYDETSLDLVALPSGNLINNSGSIDFNYEKVLVPGVDYVADLHVESLSEQIGNNLVANNIILTQNSPVTNVFRVLNQTSGEIYNVTYFTDSKIYFTYNNAPNVQPQTHERAAFQEIINELLTVNSVLTNSSGLSIFQIFLSNAQIVAGTEDCLASSFNTSLVFSDTAIFVSERWFDREMTQAQNINRLSIGQYLVDYAKGVIYLAVANPKILSIGGCTYRNSVILPQYPHLISVDNLYYQLSPLTPTVKQFSYLNFVDGQISIASLDPSDELYLNNSSTIYQFFNGQVGVFMGATFVPGVTYQPKFIRSVFEFSDLENSINPLNFAQVSSSNGYNISVSPIIGQNYEIVQFDGIHYFVLLNLNIPYLSPGITYTFTISRTSDSVSLWNASGTIVPGNPVKLILPGIGSPAVGQMVSLSWNIVISPLSRIVLDYNRGDFWVDYTSLLDEIVISYEYGDNVLDFRQGTLGAGTNYYVSYKVGALRDALVRNFSTLVNVPELTNFEIDFARESYRDCITAALTSFIQGPTISAMKNIGQTISHVPPTITESVFSGWSLGNSLLYPDVVKTTGNIQLVPGKFGSGAMIGSPGESISLPVNSALRLEEGTFESWISPGWNGIDNQAELSFTILQDGYAIDPLKVYLGGQENHPSGNVFSLGQLSVGIPNKHKFGVFIYYAADSGGLFNRWYVEIVDGYSQHSYQIKIGSNGVIYDNKPYPGSGGSTFTGKGSITFNFTANGTSFQDVGITFVSDVPHFIFDVGQEIGSNRLSLFKDASGYLTFRVYDRLGTSYSVSYDVASWQNGDWHHIGTSWKLNTKNSMDEMHLFVDGFEVPNIIRYGQRLQPYLHENFRTIDPEEVIGSTSRDTLSGTDLRITAGSNVVSSSINFSNYHIFPGDTLIINEIGFGSYTISSISGQSITLTSPMPNSLPDGRFVINQLSLSLQSNISTAANIAVSSIHPSLSGTDLVSPSSGSTVSSATWNFSSQGILPGWSISIDQIGTQTIITILQVNGNQLTLDYTLTSAISNSTFRIYSPNAAQELPGVRAVSPDYSISAAGNQIIFTNGLFAGDLILVNLLGLNSRKIKQEIYLWSDQVQNILGTQLPSPINVSEARINRVILASTSIGPTNSTLIGGTWVSSNLTTSQPSNGTTGRSLQVFIGGTNASFTSPVLVTINGTGVSGSQSEVLSFSNYGKMNSVKYYTGINFIQVNAAPINTARNAVNIKVREALPITMAENGGTAPTIRFSYPIGGGQTLSSLGGTTVYDANQVFSQGLVGNSISIVSPAIGVFSVLAVSFDGHTLTLSGSLSSFTNGTYSLLNSTTAGSGVQNGFFTFESSPGVSYLLRSGYYDFSYSSWMKVSLAPFTGNLFLGSDFEGNNLFSGALDQSISYSMMLIDTRIGESTPANQRSITKDFNSLKALSPDKNTLLFLSYDTTPLSNSAPVYAITGDNQQLFHSNIVINQNFEQSLVLLNQPLTIQNEGVLDTRSQGTIEFWVSPLMDTGNDPNNRCYFDAYGAVSEQVQSLSSVSLSVSSPIGSVLSVQLVGGNPTIDYFAGGKVLLDTKNAISETGFSLTNGSVLVSQPAFQVLSVTIVGDLTMTDYFAGGSISTSGTTIYLSKTLPGNDLPLTIIYQPVLQGKRNVLEKQIIWLNRPLPRANCQVIVNYLPKGIQGDRLSIQKDNLGNLNFTINASGQGYTVSQPIFWTKNSWHRVKATYKINGSAGSNEMRLFVDGYQNDNILQGGFYLNSDGYGYTGSINFLDPINQIMVGTAYNTTSPAFILLDNLKISNHVHPVFAPYGEPIDVNYSPNLSVVTPVSSDLYTTYLLNSQLTSSLNTDFALLVDRNNGGFEFSLDIDDAFGIVQGSDKIKEALEEIVNILKPANSRAFISYS
jgi:hypothetical protein